MEVGIMTCSNTNSNTEGVEYLNIWQIKIYICYVICLQPSFNKFWIITVNDISFLKVILMYWGFNNSIWLYLIYFFTAEKKTVITGFICNYRGTSASWQPLLKRGLLGSFIETVLVS